MINYYEKFIKNLSTLVSPLYVLLKKDSSWVWGQPQYEAFKNIKQMLAKCSVLVHYDPERPVVLTCDASAHGGAVQAQVD